MSSTQDINSIYQGDIFSVPGEGNLTILYDLSIVDFIGVEPIRSEYQGYTQTFTGEGSLTVLYDLNRVEFIGVEPISSTYQGYTPTFTGEGSLTILYDLSLVNFIGATEPVQDRAIEPVQDISSVYQGDTTTFTGEGSLAILYDLSFIDFIGVEPIQDSYDNSYNAFEGTIGYEIEHDLGTIDFIGVDPVKDAYVGNYYTILGSCGLHIEQDFGTIDYTGNDELQLYDLTNTLQIAFDVRILNKHIGLIKDSSNQTIIDTSYNNNVFPQSQLTISSDDFITNLSQPNIISLGKLETIYRDFLRNTNYYFYYPLDFPSIFDTSGTTDISGGEFTKNKLIEILTQQYIDSSGNLSYKLNGNILLNNINNLLRNINASDPFSNRINRTMSDGFIAGDLILIEQGLTFNLDVNCVDDNNVETLLLRKIVQIPVLLNLDDLT